MENINWICKSKTVNNNIVWLCNQKIKEHFQSIYTTALLGTTTFPNTVDITLGPASFGPTSDLAKDTTGFTKLGEWTLALQDGSPAMNNEFYEGKTKGIMVYNGDRNITDWSKWPNEWHYRYQTPQMCGIDKNGFNAAAAVFEFQNYQEFNTLKYTMIFRNKSNPQNYYLMPRVDLYSTGNIGVIGYGADNFDLGATMDQQVSRYKGLNWTPEISMRGQGGGNVVYNDVYEVFVKPFTRPTYPFKGEPKANDFSNLDSTLASKLLLWLDGSDPLGDGTVLADDTPVPYWFDKSSNKMRFIRHPQAYPEIKDGEKLANGRKLRVPRCKAGMKNGLSVMRFNGVNGYFNNVNDPNDPATDKWVQNPNNKNITEYTIISLQMTTDYGSQQATIFRANDYSGNCKTMIGNVAFGAPMLGFLTNSNNRNDGSTSKYWQTNINVLNQWSIFSTVVSNSNVSMFVNGINAPNSLQDWQQNQTPYKSSDGIIDSFGMTCVVGTHTTNESGSAFIGDIGEFLFFRGALSDDERQKVEGYLAVKWNLLKLLPSVNPYAVIPLPPIKVGSRVVLVKDPKLPPGPLGILYPETIGIVSQIKDQNSVLVYDSKNTGLLYWYKMTDLKVAESSTIQINTPRPEV